MVLATGIGEGDAEVRGQIIQWLGAGQDPNKPLLFAGDLDALGARLLRVIGGHGVCSEQNHHHVGLPVVPANQIRRAKQEDAGRLGGIEQQRALFVLHELGFEGAQ